jgi:hypothetical protein
MFDGSKYAAAMNGVPLGTEVTVAYNPGGNVTKKLNVVVNDTGPFARDSTGRVIQPLRPAPLIKIDLTPAAMNYFTGHPIDRIHNVTVIIPSEPSPALP